MLVGVYCIVVSLVWGLVCSNGYGLFDWIIGVGGMVEFIVGVWFGLGVVVVFVL